MVGGENDNRIIPKFLLFQLIKDQPDLRIHKRDAGVVGLRVLAPERIVLLTQLKPESTESLDHRHLRDVIPIVDRVQLELKPVLLIEVEIFLWRNKRNMRFMNADRDEERLVAVAFFTEPLDYFSGVSAIAMLRVVLTAWPVTGTLLAACLCKQTRKLLLPLTPSFPTFN